MTTSAIVKLEPPTIVPIETETVSVSQDPVAERETRAHRVADYFAKVGDLTTDITPDVLQMFYDFAHLRKGESIMGCSTQEQWAKKYAGRTARAFRYMLTGGNTKRTSSPHRNKSVNSDTPANKSNQQIVLDGIEAAHAAELKQVANRSFAEGEAAGMKKAEMIAAKKQPNPAQSTSAAATVASSIANELTLFILINIGGSGLASVETCQQIRCFAEKYQAAIADTNNEVPTPETPRLPYPELDLICLTCPRCGNQEGIQPVGENNGKRVRRYHCTKCDLKTGCNSFKPQTGAAVEAMAVHQ